MQNIVKFTLDGFGVRADPRDPLEKTQQYKPSIA